jgi:hypothetical protein
MRIALLFVALCACESPGPKTDADCVAFRESCGCSMLCGTARQERRENAKPQCDIGCVDTATTQLTDADCVHVDGECVVAEGAEG